MNNLTLTKDEKKLLDEVIIHKYGMFDVTVFNHAVSYTFRMKRAEELLEGYKPDTSPAYLNYIKDFLMSEK